MNEENITPQERLKMPEPTQLPPEVYAVVLQILEFFTLADSGFINESEA